MLDGLVLSIDVMGGDDAPDIVVQGIEYFLKHSGKNRKARFLLHGDEAEIERLLKKAPQTRERSEVHHTETMVEMDANPVKALRRGRGTSLWNAVNSVKTGEARIAVSAGNTGALMAISKYILKMRDGVQRPALAGIWPRPVGNCIVLDVGANIECDPSHLCEFAVLGEAYFRALYGKEKPSVGLLNNGTEDIKGTPTVKETHSRLSTLDFGLNYAGYVEGNEISIGNVDVIVTDGYTGNIALKTAEGTAKLVGGFVKNALSGNIISKIFSALNGVAILKLKSRMDPRKVNGAVFLGLNGIVVKSHGGTDPIGFANALNVAMGLAESNFQDEIERSLNALHEAELDIELGEKV